MVSCMLLTTISSKVNPMGYIGITVSILVNLARDISQQTNKSMGTTGGEG